MLVNDLHKFNLFVDLDLLELKKLLQFSSIKRFTAGSVVFEKGRIQAGIILILSGRMELYDSIGDAKEHLNIDTLYPGDFEGENTLFGEAAARRYNARAMDKLDLLWINTLDFRRLQNSAAAILAKLELRLIIELSNDFRKKNGEFGALRKELESLETKP
ncbi:MAG: cyclic nucleotide-binding domain-containing protein [Candidatus Cloacimonetes bacterium]|nr:cyclic nucleotide-binding domain-containing protein [Candidatus Cloacimonadota bacterium]